ncbi:MAG: AI-2E family transporter [Minisyncoccales bacterium]
MTEKDHNSKLQNNFLIGILLISILILLAFLYPFFSTLFIAAITVAAFYPIHKIILRKTNFKKNIAALLTYILLILVVLIPISILLLIVIRQAITTSENVNIWLASFLEDDYRNIPWLMYIINFLNNFSYQFSEEEIFSRTTEIIGSSSRWLITNITNVLRNLFVFFIHFFIFLLALFYFIRDGDRIVNYISSLLPLSEKYKKELIHKMKTLTYSLIYGIFGAAIIQGLLLGIGFKIAGIDNAAFWGTLGAIVSPIPYIGTAVVWLPVVGFLFLSGQVWVAIFLLIWCMIIVGLSDNLVRPYIIGSASTLHPFAVLLVIVGGTFVFGFKAIIFGPFILTITLAFLHIYKLEFQNELDNTDIIREDSYLLKKLKKYFSKKK